MTFQAAPAVWLPSPQLFAATLVCLAGSRKLGHKVAPDPFFDTVKIDVGDAGKVMQAATEASMNLRQIDASTVSIALDETTMVADVDDLFRVLNGGTKPDFDALSLADKVGCAVGCCCAVQPAWFCFYKLCNEGSASSVCPLTT